MNLPILNTNYRIYTWTKDTEILTLSLDILVMRSIYKYTIDERNEKKNK